MASILGTRVRRVEDDAFLTTGAVHTEGVQAADSHAEPDYRRHLARLLRRRALGPALESSR
jgi:hypothetical protein